MKYFKQYKEPEAKAFEITKEEAKQSLEGYWNQDALNEMFESDTPVKLFTPWAEVWSVKE